MAAASDQRAARLRAVAFRLFGLTSEITPDEFRWQDANYDRDSERGRELLFLIANDEWVKATSEIIDIVRSDTIATTLEIAIDFNGVSYSGFREGTGPIWLPVVVLPPLRQRLPDPDPLSTLTVADASGSPLMVLPHADVRHRVAAALTEIILGVAAAWQPTFGSETLSVTRDHRLLLSATIYRWLRNERPAGGLHTEPHATEHHPEELLPRIDRIRRELLALLMPYASLLEPAVVPGSHDNTHVARQLTERAIRVLIAFAESAIVVVAAERGRFPTVLTVTLPGRALHQAGNRGKVPLRPLAVSPFRWAWPGNWRRIHPRNWVLPQASLQLDLLLPSADTDRQVRVNLPDGVSPDPSRPPAARAGLEIRTTQPLPFGQLAALTSQLVDGDDLPGPARQCLADLAAARADAARAVLRDHQATAATGTPALTGAQAGAATLALRDRLDLLHLALVNMAAGEPDAGHELRQAWQGGALLDVPMQRRTSTDTVTPGVVAARARAIEDVSARSSSTAATMYVRVAVTDSAYFSTATLSGWMSALLMTVVLTFFLCQNLLGITGNQISVEVLALVLTLFSAIQAGRIERPDRSTMRGLLVPSGNPLIIASILPSVVLAVAIAFMHTMSWGVTWAGGCLAGQFLLLWLQWVLLRRALNRGLAIDSDTWPETGLAFNTDKPDYSHGTALRSSWWRKTTSEAVLAARPAYGYVVWQHGQRDQPKTLPSLLHGGRPSSPDLHISALEQPANVLALLRSGTGGQLLNYAVFRDQPKADWDCAPEDIVRVELDPGRIAFTDDAATTVSVIVGFHPGLRLTVSEHPVTALLQVAASRGLMVREIQLPIPAPASGYPDLMWARVRLNIGNDDIGRVKPFLMDVRQLAAAWPGGLTTAAPAAALVMGAQSQSEGVLRIISPDPAAPEPGLNEADVGSAAHAAHVASAARAASAASAARAHLVFADDLDIVAASGAIHGESASAKTWRVMALAADWRNGIEFELLTRLHPGLSLIGLTSTILHGKAVLLLLCHRSGHPPGRDDPRLHPSVYIDKWQSRNDLGVTPGLPLMHVHMRTPDQPGATLAVLESLRDALHEMIPGASGTRDWNVWYARSEVQNGNVAEIQLTALLPVNHALKDDPASWSGGWEHIDFPKIERRALELLAQRSASPQVAVGPQEPRLDTRPNTMLRVGLIVTPRPDLGQIHARRSPVPAVMAAPALPDFGEATAPARLASISANHVAQHPGGPTGRLRLWLTIALAGLAITAAISWAIAAGDLALPFWADVTIGGVTAAGTALAGAAAFLQLLANRKSAAAGPRVSRTIRKARSPAYELTKLATLVDKGYLDRQEYEVLKAQLLKDSAD